MSAAESIASESTLKLSTEKITDGATTCVRFTGTIDESFDGAQFAGGLRAKTLILDLGGVQKISSFGIREWSNFVRSVERVAETLFIIECSPKVMDQVNMVAGFVGKAVVYSFYAPYRCDYCDLDANALFQMDRDAQAIRLLKPRENHCESCGRDMYFDEDPATYFAFVSSQPNPVLPANVVDFLATKLDYNVLGADRSFRVDKWIDGQHTYLRLNGRLDGSFPSQKLAEGLEGVVVADVSGIGAIDLAGAAEWRNFVTMAMTRSESLNLMECPPLFLDQLSGGSDLGSQVLSLRLPYSCSACGTTASQLISVADHHKVLQFATPPEMKCLSCGKAETTCVASESVLSRLKELPQPSVNGALKSFVKAAKKRSFVREVAAPEVAKEGGNGLIAILVAAIFVVVAAIGVVFFFTVGKKKNGPDNAELIKSIEKKMALVTGAQQEKSPPWVTAKTPQYASCADLINRITCLGISPYIKDKDRGGDLARDAAIEEMLHAISVKMDSDFFERSIRPMYEDARRSTVLSYDEIQGDRSSEAYKLAESKIQSARKRARQAALSLGGGIVPLQPADTYWEEYKAEAGKKENEFLVFVNYEINMDAARRLIDIWTTEREVGGGKAVTAFPLLAWGMDDFEGGVVVTQASGQLKELGASKHSIVVGAGKENVMSVAELSSAMTKNKSLRIIK